MQPGRLWHAPAKLFPSATTKIVKPRAYEESDAERAWFSSSQGVYLQDDGTAAKGRPAKRMRAIDKEFFLSVLGASATKRDAKGYLARFLPPKGSVERSLTEDNASEDAPTTYARGINLGTLYSSLRSIAQTPCFTQDRRVERGVQGLSDLHVAIVKLRNPQLLDQQVLNGVALTLGQLAKLGLPSAVVLDVSSSKGNQDTLGYQTWRDATAAEAARLAAAIDDVSKRSAHVLDQVLSVRPPQEHIQSNVRLTGTVHVNYDTMLYKSLRAGMVTILPPIAYNEHQQAMQVSADDVVLALTHEFAGLLRDTPSGTQEQSSTSTETFNSGLSDRRVSLDRIIILDPAGGIPAPERQDRAHVFINLDQEYYGIRNHLLRVNGSPVSPRSGQHKQHTTLGASNPFSAFAEEQTWAEGAIPGSNTSIDTDHGSDEADTHLINLELLQQTLTLLPPSSSALIVRPQDVAASALTSSHKSGVGTRQQRNPLIHNLLTDKPIISSSLPAGRVATAAAAMLAFPASPDNPTPHATFVKRGMPVTIIPDPIETPWGPQGTILSLKDPRIDFGRLLHLIEDSFGRKLDVNHYLDRIQNHLAGVIIAGEYEGGAVFTWEDPPHTEHDRLGQDILTIPRPVPYLDKFAVLKRSQGAGGVADVVFNAMVRTCFPGGVVWRSRKDNPVNRWYFERADGTWKIPGTQWTMFWTGDELWGGTGAANGKTHEQWREQRWKDYVDVCSGIGASWADKRAPD